MTEAYPYIQRGCLYAEAGSTSGSIVCLPVEHVIVELRDRSWWQNGKLVESSECWLSCSGREFYCQHDFERVCALLEEARK